MNTKFLLRFIFLALIFTSIIARRMEECQRKFGDQLVWEYDVRRSYRIGAYQEVEAEYGPAKVSITCIGIDSLSEEENEDAWIIGGGIGKNFLKVKFRSRYSRGLHYRVFVYGQLMLKQN